MSGCMMKGCCHPKLGGSVEEEAGLHVSFRWASKAVGGRWRGVLVPDPCLSGAAMFTVRKEAVNCVCSHLSKTEQLLLATPPPPTFRGRGRPVCRTFLRTGEIKSKRRSISLTDSIWSASVRLWERMSGRSDGPPPARPREVIDRAFYLRYRVSPWCKVPVALLQRVTAFLTRSWTDHLYPPPPYNHHKPLKPPPPPPPELWSNPLDWMLLPEVEKTCMTQVNKQWFGHHDSRIRASLSACIMIESGLLPSCEKNVHFHTAFPILIGFWVTRFYFCLVLQMDTVIT